MAESLFPGLQSGSENSTDEPVIPDKLYFKIGEVCEITGVKQHVLRYWESEFNIIRPQRASSKQRLYRRIDVENIIRIKKLLYGKGFTIAGARKALGRGSGESDEEMQPEVIVDPVFCEKRPLPAEQMAPVSNRQLLGDIKSELLHLKELLEKNC